MNETTENDLFIGKFPEGLVYADKSKRNYPTCAFLSYRTLELKIEKNCPERLKKQIEIHAEEMRLKKGQKFPRSYCGQYIILGE